MTLDNILNILNIIIIPLVMYNFYINRKIVEFDIKISSIEEYTKTLGKLEKDVAELVIISKMYLKNQGINL
jgi:hypothetical protein